MSIKKQLWCFYLDFNGGVGRLAPGDGTLEGFCRVLETREGFVDKVGVKPLQVVNCRWVFGRRR